MKYIRQIIVISSLLTLGSFTNIGLATTNTAQNNPSVKQSQMQKTGNESSGYQKYLQMMNKLNEDRQCAGLTPQKVYTPQEYQSVYSGR